MERGLYIAASGMLTEQVRQDLISNDLANASTPGYKSERVTTQSFGEMLVRDSTGTSIGGLGLGARIESQTTDLTPGPLRTTGEPLDLAVEGEGFFAVRGASGTRYTRDGQFQVSSKGTLVTATGDEVLGPNGQPVRVGAGGTVAAGMIGATRLEGVRREGDNLFAGTARGAAAGSVRGGALEGSAVDPITTIDATLAKATGQVGTI